MNKLLDSYLNFRSFDVLKKIIIIGLSVLGFVLLFVGGFMGWFSFQVRQMNPVENTQISSSLYAIKGDMGNLYLLKTDSGVIAFDAADNIEKIMDACKEFNIDPNTVKTVFLSHSDGDHVNGLPTFPNAKVYISKDEELSLKSKEHRHFMGMSFMNKLPVSTYETLNDGDSVIIDNVVVHAISTPGHTIGSMCYRVNDAIFTGDLCLVINNKINPMLELFTEDRAMDSISIHKIAKLNMVNEIYTGHSGFYKDFKTLTSGWH